MSTRQEDTGEGHLFSAMRFPEQIAPNNKEFLGAILMSTRQEHPSQGRLFSAMSFPEQIALNNKRMFR